ncbi:MAG: RNase P subunit p30 [Desulfurococcales archaeon]|nr:RNase P subunit p30 [Desulfurococcales archaeon]
MRGFIDLWLDIEPDEVEKAIDVGHKMGYTAFGLEDHGFNWRVKKLRDKKITLVKRITLSEEKESKLKEKLRGIKLSFPIVSVKPQSIQVARFAARDGRVDTIIVDKDTAMYIDKTQVLMVKRYRKVLEIPLEEFLKANDRAKAMIYRRLLLILHYNTPFIISSRARKWNKIHHPLSIISLLTSLLDLDNKDLLLHNISGLPLEILVKNGVKV